MKILTSQNLMKIHIYRLSRINNTNIDSILSYIYLYLYIYIYIYSTPDSIFINTDTNIWEVMWYLFIFLSDNH